MDEIYEYSKVEDIQWFYSKAKVPVCLAITDSLDFLNKLRDAGILCEEEALELQGDTRTDHRVVYESLCWIEDKDICPQEFFEFLFQKCFLKKYPDLKPIYKEYKEGNYRYDIHSKADTDKDSMIFADDKVQICLAITDRFPFLHGLQDLTFLSESESLKLQADERSVSRVIYESLSLIQKKDLKLNVVFEYILQKCYLKLYPGLQVMLQETRRETDAPFNGGQYPIFGITTDLLEFFDHNKTYICEAIDERFPFLNGLHDRNLLNHIQLLKLQADKRSTKEVLYDALYHIKTISDIEIFFVYVFKKYYLKMYPDLHKILQCLNAALTLDICPLSPAKVKDTSMDMHEQNSSQPSTVAYEDEISDGQEQNYMEPSGVTLREEIIETFDQDSSEFIPVSYVEETRDTGEQNANEPSTVSYGSEPKEVQSQEPNEPFTGPDDTLPPPMGNCGPQLNSNLDPPDVHLDVGNTGLKPEVEVLPPLVRKCRLHPISYSEPPDLVCEVNDQGKIHKEASVNPNRHRYRRRKAQETGKISLNLSSSDLIQGTKPVTVRVEFPKQVFNENFQVRCGNKKGIFKKARWTGNSSKDQCIFSDGKEFSVITFEKYGGKAAYKNWKKSIHCEKIKLECLFEAEILKRPWFNKKPNRVKR